jgi:type III pantothenate kinase
MLLAIDVGNSNTVLAVFDGTELRHTWRLHSNARATADELALQIRALLSTLDSDARLGGIVLCSTVPALLRTLRRTFARWFADVPAVIIEPGMDIGVRLDVLNPPEVGTDRIVNTRAAFELFGGPAVVVDLGTSTNFDVVGPDGAYLGGAIAPGIELSLEALTARAAQLSRVALQAPPSAIGRNTAECLQSGMIYGAAGQVDGIVGRLVAELGGRARAVVATGGLATLVVGECATITDHRPDLTLVGLRLAFEHLSR